MSSLIGPDTFRRTGTGFDLPNIFKTTENEMLLSRSDWRVCMWSSIMYSDVGYQRDYVRNTHRLGEPDLIPGEMESRDI